MSVSSIISVGNWAKPTNIRLNSGIFAKIKLPVTFYGIILIHLQYECLLGIKIKR